MKRGARRRTLLGWGVVRVEGRSMAPTLEDGDYVIVRDYGPGRRRPRVGDIALLDHPRLGRLLKRLADESDGHFSLIGDGVATTPSIDLGSVPPERLLARVVWRVARGTASTPSRSAGGS